MRGDESWISQMYTIVRGKSYSGSLLAQPDIAIRAIDCDGRHPSLLEGDKGIIYMMTCSPLSAHEDLKFLIREGITKLYPSGTAQASYETLQFSLAPWEPGTTGHYLLVGLQVDTGRICASKTSSFANQTSFWRTR
jgi:hypothetical protein